MEPNSNFLEEFYDTKKTVSKKPLKTMAEKLCTITIGLPWLQSSQGLCILKNKKKKTYGIKNASFQPHLCFDVVQGWAL